MMIDKWLIFCLFSISFRWLLFDYRKFQFLRDALGKISQELINCVYCQVIECSLIAYIVLIYGKLLDFNLAFLLFGSLSNGFIAIILDGLIQDMINLTEEKRDFSFSEKELD